MVDGSLAANSVCFTRKMLHLLWLLLDLLLAPRAFVSCFKGAVNTPRHCIYCCQYRCCILYVQLPVTHPFFYITCSSVRDTRYSNAFLMCNLHALHHQLWGAWYIRYSIASGLVGRTFVHGSVGTPCHPVHWTIVLEQSSTENTVYAVMPQTQLKKYYFHPVLS